MGPVVTTGPIFFGDRLGSRIRFWYHSDGDKSTAPLACDFGRPPAQPSHSLDPLDNRFVFPSPVGQWCRIGHLSSKILLGRGRQFVHTSALLNSNSRFSRLRENRLQFRSAGSERLEPLASFSNSMDRRFHWLALRCIHSALRIFAEEFVARSGGPSMGRTHRSHCQPSAL